MGDGEVSEKEYNKGGGDKRKNTAERPGVIIIKKVARNMGGSGIVLLG